MITPDLAPSSVPEIQENLANGYGYWAFTPEDPKSFADQAEQMREYGDFLETGTVIDLAHENGSVLVQGAPGAGKSHLVRELQMAAVINNVPTFCLTTHINGGKKTGIDNIEEPFAQFKEAVGDGQGLVILDNIDYLGYRGSSRTRSVSSRYANAVEAKVDELHADPHLVTVGTAHNDEWREGYWTWNDPNVDDPAKSVLESFGSQLVFEGNMALVGLAHIMANKGHGLGESARAIRNLHSEGRAKFFYANHVDPSEYLADPVAALAKLHAGRNERLKRT
jgi:hypothetical protein